MSSEERIIRDVQEFGWHIINVFEGAHPCFSYTVGVYKTYGFPELFISGLRGEIAATILDSIVAQVKSGKSIAAETESDMFFEGYNCYFDLVKKQYYSGYFGKAVWFYGNEEFPTLQCVWPNTQHLYPWQTTQEFAQDVLI